MKLRERIIRFVGEQLDNLGMELTYKFRNRSFIIGIILMLFLGVKYQGLRYFLVLAILPIVIYVVDIQDYKDTTFHKDTKIPHGTTYTDKGIFGEYHTYRKLRYLEGPQAKFLFNAYIPKADGGTTEIDVLMISNKGIFVFESKNYSGWIFGNENRKNWYQSLPVGRGRRPKRIRFYNPVMQNRQHLNHLKVFLGKDVPMWSIIAFSERCTLKEIKMVSEDIKVINRYDLRDTVQEILDKVSEDVLSESDIKEIYEMIYPYTQVDEATKEKHIMDIRDSLNRRHNLKAESEEEDVVEDNPEFERLDEEEAVVLTEELPELKEDSQEEQLLSAVDVQLEEAKESEKLQCPLCGNDLVVRTASRGERAGKQFYGCSNFPKCTYIQNIDE